MEGQGEGVGRSSKQAFWMVYPSAELDYEPGVGRIILAVDSSPFDGELSWLGWVWDLVNQISKSESDLAGAFHD